MKQITLSIMLLSSYAALYSSEQPERIEFAAPLLAKSRDSKGNTMLHSLIRRYAYAAKIGEGDAGVKQQMEDGMNEIKRATISDVETRILSQRFNEKLNKDDTFKKFNIMKKRLLLETDKKTVLEAVAALQAHVTTAINDLIAIGFDVNLQNDTHETPLHFAVKYRIPAIVDVLVKAGANSNIACNKGFTPLALAFGIKTKDKPQDNSAIITSLLASPITDITSLFTLDANQKYPCFRLHAEIYRSLPNTRAIIAVIAARGVPNRSAFFEAVNGELAKFKNKALSKAESEQDDKADHDSDSDLETSDKSNSGSDSDPE